MPSGTLPAGRTDDTSPHEVHGSIHGQSMTVDEAPAELSAQLRLLGDFGLTDRDGVVVPIGSQRAQALIAYLVLHRDAPQSRRQVSFVLWPDSTEAQALNNLRQLIHQIRLTWPDATQYLVADATTLTLRSGVDIALEIDIDAYDAAVAVALAADRESEPTPALARAAFERAAGLYRGDLLPGSYDEWVVSERERLISAHRRLLDRLVGLLEQQGDYRAAIEHGDERLRLDPLDERTYRWLMRLHALNQDRAGALRVYQNCAAVLERELGVEPDSATRQAYEQVVRLGGTQPGAMAPSVGVDAAPAVGGRPADLVPLVGRENEWAQVMSAWDRMAEGQAHLIVIGGEAGIGKSRLAAELSDWAGRQGVKSARTRAYAAEGRLSYAPVADWLRSPILASALPRLDVGSLSEISRLLPELVARRPDVPRPSARIEAWQRQAFFQSLASAFLVADHPLLLVLDDLQWCDADTLEWIHFLLRSDRHAKVVVVGTVRTDEVDRSHPLAGLTAGLRDAGQLTEIHLRPLDPSETAALATHVAGRRLKPEQARYIHLETEGNPLFVVETVRAGLVESDDISSLPPKVQEIIGARLAQLSQPARDLASLAATVGRAFSLEILRRSGRGDDDRIVAGLDELLRRQIVREQGNGAYDFSHDKIREVAYVETTEARRRLLHRRVAEGLERVHATALDAVATQIAAQYANAGLPERAAAFYLRGAEVAQRIGANLEAISLLRRGLSLLETLPPSVDRDSRELGLQAALGASLVATEGYGASEVLSVYGRARDLCQVLGRPATSPILRGLAIASLAQVRIDECQALGDHMLSLTDGDDDPVLRVEAHYVIAMALLLKGAAMPAKVQLEASLAHYDRARSATHIGLYSQDPAVVCLIRLSFDLWILGDPIGAVKRRAESLLLAEELGHPFSHAYALVWDAHLQILSGNPALARTQAEAAISLGREYAMPFWLSLGTIVQGWAVAEGGDIEAGIKGMRAGMAAYAATNGHAFVTFHLGLLANQYGRLGNVERGLTLIAEGLALAERTGERWYEPELHRCNGELLETATDRDGEAEAAYLRGIDVARFQGAHALELRATTRLSELWLRQGRRADAALLLEPIVGSFAATSDTTDLPDLARARVLLTQAGST
jgi:DNA-binding SARP family transcriptional activator/predicted ATPase